MLLKLRLWLTFKGLMALQEYPSIKKLGFIYCWFFICTKAVQYSYMGESFQQFNTLYYIKAMAVLKLIFIINSDFHRKLSIFITYPCSFPHPTSRSNNSSILLLFTSLQEFHFYPYSHIYPFSLSIILFSFSPLLLQSCFYSTNSSCLSFLLELLARIAILCFFGHYVTSCLLNFKSPNRS